MTRWPSIFRALADIRYAGAIVIESFMPNVRSVAVAACIWREMAPSADTLAAEAAEEGKNSVLLLVTDGSRKFMIPVKIPDED